MLDLEERMKSGLMLSLLETNETVAIDLALDDFPIKFLDFSGMISYLVGLLVF